MRPAGPIFAALLAGVAWGQAPAYTAAGIVKSSDYTLGPFAPNSVVTIFGSNLAYSTRPLEESDIINNTVPAKLNGAGVTVYVDDWPAPLLYVSPTQVNFVVPGNHSAGDVPVRVVREGVSGPVAMVTLLDAAPALFAADGYAIATHGLGSLLTDTDPAGAGEIVVIYATGLGKSLPNPDPGVFPSAAAYLKWEATERIYLDGVPVDAIHVKYVGVTPFSAGLYQINLELPDNAGTDPEIRVEVAGQISSPGLRLLAR